MTGDQMMQLATGYWTAAAINTAVELNLFAGLESPVTVESLGSTHGVNNAALRDLLLALTGMGLLEAQGDCFVLSSAARPWLSEDSEQSLLDALRYNMDLYRLWTKLPDCIRTGIPVIEGAGQLGEDAERTQRFVRGMESRGRWLAPALVESLSVPTGACLLDVGCGSGVFSRMMLQRDPTLKVTLFDLPAVLKGAKTIWEEAGMDRHVRFHPGNYQADRLPGPCDCILFAGALHQESEARAESLFASVAAALSRRGQFFVIDLMTEREDSPEAVPRLFSLNMRLLQPEGHVYSAETVEKLLRKAGFSSVDSLDSTVPAYRILRAAM